MRPITRTLFVLAAATLLSAPAFGAGDAAAAAEKAKQACAACHGADGNTPSSPDFPKLGGQHADYLFHALRQYKSGTRKNAVMAGQAQNLSTQEMEDLAEYYAAQKSTLYIVPLRRLAQE
jgi:cytochrome c553